MFNNKKYTYVSVHYEDDEITERTYYYISDEDEIKVGDRVLVDRNGSEATGIVAKVEEFKKKNVPFPIEKTKHIIRKVDNNFKLDDDFWDDFDEDEFHDLKLIEKSYDKLFLNNMYGRLSIKRLMNLMFVKKYDYFEKHKKLFYVPRMNLFFYKEFENNYRLAEMEYDVFTKDIYSILEREAIEVKREQVYNIYCAENYRKAILFCKNNCILIHDDTDIDDFEEEKLELNMYEKTEKRDEFKSIDEIIEYLKNYNPAHYEFPNPDYYIEEDKIIHYMGHINYDMRVFDLYKYLIDNGYVNIERTNAYYEHIKNKDEKWQTWNIDEINYEKLNYMIVRLYNEERVCEGLVNSYASNGKLLKILEKLKYYKQNNFNL